ncbi:MAG: SRPBCC family protein [Terracidiphilus sp.]
MLNEYQFVTSWRVRGAPAEVYRIISRPLDYPRWWPAVYLDALELDAGDDSGLNARVRFHTKGWLPYTLRWDSHTVMVAEPKVLAIRASGDLDGRGIWHFEGDGEFTNVYFDWKVRADKLLLRVMSPALRPAFAANHRWAMKQGEISLERELARRHARTPEERALVPPPPPPAKSSGLALTAAGLAVFAGALAFRKSKR